MNFYVYAYLREDGTPYYIGKGKDKRAYAKHLSVAVPANVNRITFIETNLTDIGALAIERRMIKWYGRKDIGTGILRNLTEGGDGPSGKVVSAESRLKMSAAKKGRPAHNKGVPLSDAAKEKLRINNTGHKVTQETRDKLSALSKGRASCWKGHKGPRSDPKLKTS